MSNLVPTLLLSAMLCALGAGLSAAPHAPAADAPHRVLHATRSGADEIPTLPTIVVRPDATLARATLLPTVSVRPSAAERAAAEVTPLDNAIVSLHAFGPGPEPRSGLDMPYYSFGKSVYRLRKE